MAGEWIKVESATPDKPELVKMARILNKPRAHVFGCLVTLWAWFDRNSVDGRVDGVALRDLDGLAGMNGLCTAMIAVNWLTFDEDHQRAELPNFSRHNGESAKKRALNSERQRRWRVTNVDGQALHDRLPEKRREQEISTPPSPLPGGRAVKPRGNGKGTPGWWESPQATFDEAKRLGVSTRGIDWIPLKAAVREALAHPKPHTHAREDSPPEAPPQPPAQQAAQPEDDIPF
jgi:hypothetical protein